MKKAIFTSILLLSSITSIAATPKALEKAVSKAIKNSNAKFSYAIVDLNNDSYPDALVLLEGDSWCGSGGCVFLVFKGTSTGYSLVSRSTIVRPPIRVLKSSHHGWKDLIVFSGGTGSVLLKFNGTKYPSNPSLEPKATQKQLDSAPEVIQ